MKCLLQIASILQRKIHFYNVFQETEKDVSLMNMKIDIQEFNEVLAEINDNQRESIVSFLKSSDLVIWLRTALSGFMI